MIGAGGTRRRLTGLLAVQLGLLATLIGASPVHAQGAYSFVPDPTQPSLPAGSILVEVADLTGNGVPDLIIENTQTDTLGVMLGNGAGGFGPPSSVALAGRPVWVDVADFNDDGHPDLLVPIETKETPREFNLLAEHVQILFGDGKGGFTPGPLIALPEAGPVYVGDFTGNGNADVVVGPNGCWGEGNDSEYHMLLGDGHGNLTPGPTSVEKTYGCLARVGEFIAGHGDDIAAYSPRYEHEPGEIQVLPGEPGGGFGSPIVTPVEGSNLPTGPAELYGAGAQDLILEDFTEPGSFSILNGDGTGHFTESGPFLTGQENLFSLFAVGDFGGAGPNEVATIGRSGIAVLENNGDALMPRLVAGSEEASEAGEAFVADVNGDGRPDLILRARGTVSVLLNELTQPQGGRSSITAVASARRRASLRTRVDLSRRVLRGRRSLRVSGRLVTESGGVTAAAACSGRVVVLVTLHGRSLARSVARVTKSCRFSDTLAIDARRLTGQSHPTLSLSFAGNTYLRADATHRRI